jgi:membrane-associated progesterone receptor component
MSLLASFSAQLSELSTIEIVALSVLFFIALHLAVTIALDCRSKKKVAPVPPKPKPVPRAYSVAELAQRNGTGEDKAIWLAIKGKIYDVSSKPHFYGPGAGYGMFAGRDVTRAMALASTDLKDVENNSIADVDDLTTLREWIAMFEAKYDVVGWLDGNEEAAAALKTN